MNCNCNKKKPCGCEFNIKTVGVCDVTKLNIAGSDRSLLNWTEISVPEMLCIPPQKPDIEGINQVNASVSLDCVKLIETPFAYKNYVLYTFYQQIDGVDTALPPLVTTLDTSVDALLTPQLTNTVSPYGNVIDILNILQVDLSTLTNITGVPELIATIKNVYEPSIDTLVSDIETTIASVDAAAANLLAALAVTPLSAQLICTAIDALVYSLTRLQTLVNSVIPTIQTIIDGLNAADTAIGDVDVTAAIAAATAILTTSIGAGAGNLQALTAAVLAAITPIITLVAPIDCTNAYAFEIIGNTEGTCLSGRKLVIEGTLKQKLVYTGEVDVQSVHSAHYDVPFITFIIAYPKFEDLVYETSIQVYDPVTDGPIYISGYIYNIEEPITVDLCEDFNLDTCIEDIYVYPLDKRTVFKNVTVFIKAKPAATCN